MRQRKQSKNLSKGKAGMKPLSLELRIKRALSDHLEALGFVKCTDSKLHPPTDSKDCFRAMHSAQRLEKLEHNQTFLRVAWKELKSHFAHGSDVEPDAVSPKLEQVDAGTWQSRLFRLAASSWSVPVSEGYGRRMRFLVWDQSNAKLIGLFALGDPVFNLRVRDQLIGWDAAGRRDRLVNVLDAYVLGAVPPYNQLLGTKLIASLIRSEEVRAAFRERYAGSRGLISRKKKKPALVMVTTSSALGRSSAFNRLALGGVKIFESIGYTSGWGHFHIPAPLFDQIRQYLRQKGHDYAGNNRFGDGPNWKLRAIRLALGLIGMDQEMLCHGISREVFVCRLARNATEVLSGKHRRPIFKGLLTVDEISRLAIDRWISPRGVRRPEYRQWRAEQFYELIDPVLLKATTIDAGAEGGLRGVG
jgi:Domain of unknown function (DUF4338)